VHDLDRTLDASEWESNGDLEAGDYDGEYDEEYDGEYAEEWEAGDLEPEYAEEWEASGDFNTEGVFDEGEEMELAAELLTVSSDEELEQFLGKLIKRAGQKIRKFAKSSTGRALGGILKGAAKKALPILGRVAGTALGGPVGGALGGKLASLAGRKVFGLELEGLSPEDQEFEVAKRYVRFAGAAAKNAAMAPRSAPAMSAAKTAVKKAARTHAPGLVGQRRGPAAPAGYGGRQRSGRWIRRGRRIVLLGV
jgi:hypothetical protein